MKIIAGIKQAIAVAWTLVAVALALIVALAIDLSNNTLGGVSTSPTPWWARVAVFFGFLLLITFPVYLLIILWALVAKPERD